jgi:hypothetical protein
MTRLMASATFVPFISMAPNVGRLFGNADSQTFSCNLGAVKEETPAIVRRG